MQRQALVVGINQYPDMTSLTKPAKDAEAIAQLLEAHGEDRSWSVKRLPEMDDKCQVAYGTGDLLEKEILLTAISELFNPNTNHPPEVALLFFAGHGFRKQQDGKMQGFLAASDTDFDEEESGIPLTWLRGELLRSPIKHKIIWLDCCHSGELMKFTSSELESWLVGDSHSLIVACRDDRSAYAIGEHGVLTTVLLPGYEEKRRFEYQVFLKEILGNNKSQKIAIIGEPGAGKTTLLQKIAFWVLELEFRLSRALRARDSLTPVGCASSR